MADINHAITFGIGTPGDVSHFLLFGLSPATVVIPVEVEGLISVVEFESRTPAVRNWEQH